MSTRISLPVPGDGSMTGTLVRWCVREGDRVQLGQAVAEVMFDAATVEIPATSAGRVARHCVRQGADLRVGAPLIELD